MFFSLSCSDIYPDLVTPFSRELSPFHPLKSLHHRFCSSWHELDQSHVAFERLDAVPKAASWMIKRRSLMICAQLVRTHDSPNKAFLITTKANLRHQFPAVEWYKIRSLLFPGGNSINYKQCRVQKWCERLLLLECLEKPFEPVYSGAVRSTS